MSAQQGPSLRHRLRWKRGAAAAHKKMQRLLLFPSNQNCNSAPRILLELKLTSTASFFNFPLLCPSLLPPRYFSSVVRNDLNFSTSFLFLSQSWSHLFISSSFFCERKFRQVLPNCLLSAAACDVCLRALVKMRKGLEWFPPILLTGNGCKQNMWL